MLNVRFEGLCAFREASDGVRVLTPDFHMHRAALVTNAAAVDLKGSSWYPDLMFELPDADPSNAHAVYYVWLLDRVTMTLGAGGTTSWPDAAAMKSIVDLRAKHSQSEFSGAGMASSVALRGGSLAPVESTKRCFAWFRNGVQEGNEAIYAEVMEWEGKPVTANGRLIIESTQGEIALATPDARFRVTNTRPEPDALSHHFHAYYRMLRLKDTPLELRYSGACVGPFYPRIGNCTPTTIIP